jgi:hypothetical protein
MFNLPPSACEFVGTGKFTWMCSRATEKVPKNSSFWASWLSGCGQAKETSCAVHIDTGFGQLVPAGFWAAAGNWIAFELHFGGF